MISMAEYKQLFFDTSIWIYFLEGHRKYGLLAKKLLTQVEAGMVKGYISALTLTEILAGPYRNNNDLLAHEYQALIYYFPHLEIRAIDLDIAIDAARIQGVYDFSTPDSLLLSTALQTDAGAFITNDRKLQRFSEIKVLQLVDLY